MTWKEYKYWFMRTYNNQQYENYGCGTPLFFMCLLLVAFLLMGCRSVRSTESSVDRHHIQLLTQRMDSMLHATSTWQKSIYDKQSALVDSFKHSEVRDTSRTYFLGAKGDTIKETVIIKEYIEREHSSSESTQELREEFFRQTDSLLQVNRSMEAKMDSMLQSHQKTAVVEKKPSFVERLKWIGIGVLLALFGCLAIATSFMRKEK